MGDNSAAVAFSTYGCKESGPGDLDVLFSNLKCIGKDGNKGGPLSGILLLSSDVKTD